VSQLKNYTQILREHGLRATPQRELILEMLAGSREHPSADYLFARVKERFPALSLNTIYKTLDLFEQRGLIKRFNVGENIYRYDADIHPHAHVICLNCKRVDDINAKLSDLTERVKNEVAGHSGYRIISADLYFYGLCEDCRKGR